MNTLMAKEWLKASKVDLDSVEHLMKLPHLTAVAAFHAHQSIEKSFKALIEYQGLRVPKQHDLIKLKKQLENLFEFSDDDEDTLDSLNALYIDARYPGELGLLPYGQPTKNDIALFYNLALTIHQKSEACIK